MMVGEIRDTETAEIAVQASLTGHLVLSTLHTNTAVGAITRLQDMGVEPFLLSSSLTGVMAQRLVRTLCPDCRQSAPATDEEKRLLGITDARTVTLYHPQGCPACNHKGFRGRTAIHELIVVDATLRDLIHRQARNWSWNVMSGNTLRVSAATALRKCSPEKPLSMKFCG